MEGPTPVSAMLHSCTLVMAGFMFLANILDESTDVSLRVLCLSILLCMVGKAQDVELKRIIAVSTTVMVVTLYFLRGLLVSASESFLGLVLVHACV